MTSSREFSSGAKMLKFALIWFILAFILGPLIGKFTKGNVHIASDRECDEKIIKIEHVNKNRACASI